MVKTFYAVLSDSFREALDRKLLLLLMILTALPIVFCWSISFEKEPVEVTLKNLSNRLNRVHPRHGRRHSRRIARMKLNITVHDVAPVSGEDSWPKEIQGGHVVDLSFTEPGELEAFLEKVGDYFSSFGRRQIRGGKEKMQTPGGQPPQTGQTETPEKPGIEEKLSFLKARFEFFGFNHVVARRVQGAEERFLIAVKGDYPHEIIGAHKLSLLFGLFRDLPLYMAGMSVAEFTIKLQQGLADIFAGVFVMVITVIATSSFVPNMLQKGTLDLVLARPISRVRLLLYKYVGGLWFILLFSCVLITGCWLGISVQTGYWNPWFLLSIGTLTCIFAVLYSVSVFIGVVTRSSHFAALATLGVWILSSTIVGIRHMIHMMIWGAEVPKGLVQTFDTAYWILPKIKDISHFNTYAMSKAHLSEATYNKLFAHQIPEVDWAVSIGSTALFTLCMLTLAGWFFYRRDY